MKRIIFLLVMLILSSSCFGQWTHEIFDEIMELTPETVAEMSDSEFENIAILYIACMNKGYFPNDSVTVEIFDREFKISHNNYREQAEPFLFLYFLFLSVMIAWSAFII